MGPILGNINNVIQKYLSPHIIEEIHKQMCKSVIYRRVKFLEITDTFRLIGMYTAYNSIGVRESRLGFMLEVT